MWSQGSRSALVLWGVIYAVGGRPFKTSMNINESGKMDGTIWDGLYFDGEPQTAFYYNLHSGEYVDLELRRHILRRSSDQQPVKACLTLKILIRQVACPP